jgi:uncharacterized damage-inducible protein DinB
MLLHVLNPAEGFSSGIGFFVGGMDEVREQLQQAVEGMTSDQLGRRAVPGAHSIAALVLHIGEAEWWWMQCNVSGHKLTPEDRQAPYWDVLKRPDSFASKLYSAQFCLDEIAKIRNQTHDLLASFNDDDLERIISFERRGERHEHSLRWILHHLIDHEAQHKGQILMLKRLLAS